MTKPLDLKAVTIAIWLWTVVLLSLLAIPTLYLIAWSFWGTDTVGLLDTFTFHWYSAVLGSLDWWSAFAYSISIAAAATLISSLSIICHFYFAFWEKGKYQSFAFFLILGPLFVPSIIYALALRTMFATPEWVTLIIGNVALLFPVQYFMVESGNESIRGEWIYGAAIVGATHLENIRYVLLPNFKGPVIWTFAMGFLIAFDEVVIATFIINGANPTIPKKMWDAVGTTMDPTPAVLGVLLLVFALVVVRSSATVMRYYSVRGRRASMDNTRFSVGRLAQFFTAQRIKRDFLFAIAIAVIIRLLLLRQLPFEMVASEFVIDIILVCLTFPYPILYELFPYRELFRTVFAHEEKNRDTVLILGRFFLDRAMNSFDEGMESAFREGVILSERELDSFCRLCFERGKGIYHGTDSNAPSEFMHRYPYYLSYQENNQDNQVQPGIRILLVGRAVLAQDYKTKRQEFEAFRDWHSRNSIDLFQVEPSLAEQRAAEYKLPATDLGIWNNYTVSFLRVPQGQAKLVIQYATTEQFSRSRAYFLSLIDRASEIHANHTGVECVPVPQAEIDRYKERVRRQWNQ